MLGLHTQGASPDIGAPDAANGAIQKVARVELEARLVCVNFQHTARSGVFHLGCHGGQVAFAIQHKVMVVAFAELQLLVILFNPLADFHSVAKIKWRTRYRLHFTCGDERVIYRRVIVGIDR